MYFIFIIQFNSIIIFYHIIINFIILIIKLFDLKITLIVNFIIKKLNCALMLSNLFYLIIIMFINLDY